MPLIVKNSKDYKGYLASERWKDLARAVKSRADNRCQLCNDNKCLECHHRDYNKIGGKHEHEDLVCLCKRCHGLVHKEVLA